MIESALQLKEQIHHAASLLRAGRLVAFPTETVYGLGANALDAAAVERIFEAKGRPSNSPIIVHVSSMAMVQTVVSDWPEEADVLARTFWPGPLTFVLNKRSTIPDIVTAGLETVGVRMPDHPVALALLETARLPIAAPSANRFSMLSPTTAEHVRQSLGSRVDYVLDGGPCTVGIESTVLSLVEDEPVLLRPGGISRSQIEDLIGPIRQMSHSPAGAHPSPGMHARHYSPRTRLLMVYDGELPDSGRGVYLQLHHRPRRAVDEVILMPADPVSYATQIYGTLHDLDARHYDWIAVDTPESTPHWEAVLDRLKRASNS